MTETEKHIKTLESWRERFARDCVPCIDASRDALREVDELRREVADWRDINRVWTGERELEAVRAELVGRSAEVEELRAELTTAKDELDKLMNNVEAQLQRAEGNVQALAGSHASLKAQLADEQRANSATLDHVLELKAQLRGVTEERDALASPEHASAITTDLRAECERFQQATKTFFERSEIALMRAEAAEVALNGVREDRDLECQKHQVTHGRLTTLKIAARKAKREIATMIGNDPSILLAWETLERALKEMLVP